MGAGTAVGLAIFGLVVLVFVGTVTRASMGVSRRRRMWSAADGRDRGNLGGGSGAGGGGCGGSDGGASCGGGGASCGGGGGGSGCGGGGGGCGGGS